MRPGAKSTPQHIDTLENRLFEAEAQLWELSLEKEVPDMLLPPAVLRATFGDALMQPQPKTRKKVPPKVFSSDVSYLHEGSPRSRPRPSSATLATSAKGATVPMPPSTRPPVSARPSSGRPAPPPSRADVHAVQSALERRLKTEGETVPVFDAALEALIGQVKAGCADRGALLNRVRTWMLQHVWWQESELRAARHAEERALERINELQDEIELMMREPGGWPRCPHLPRSTTHTLPAFATAHGSNTTRTWHFTSTAHTLPAVAHGPRRTLYPHLPLHHHGAHTARSLSSASVHSSQARARALCVGAGRRRASTSGRRASTDKGRLDAVEANFRAGQVAHGGSSSSRASKEPVDLDDLDDEAVLDYFNELVEPDAASLLDRLMDNLANLPDSNLLGGVLKSVLAVLGVEHGYPPDDLARRLITLTQGLRKAVSEYTPNVAGPSVQAVLQGLHGAAPMEALAVVKDETSRWPAKQIIALAKALHLALDGHQRLALVTALEPQFLDEECEFLAAACAREKTLVTVATQTGDQPAGSKGVDWPRIMQEYLELDQGQRHAHRPEPATCRLHQCTQA